jgi:hypothetical protein
MLWVWTCVLDAVSEAPKRRGEEPSLIGPGFWRLSGAAVAGIALLFTVHLGMPHWHRDPMARMMAKMTPPRNLVPEMMMESDYLDYPNVGPLPDVDDDGDGDVDESSAGELSSAG